MLKKKGLLRGGNGGLGQHQQQQQHLQQQHQLGHLHSHHNGPTVIGGVQHFPW